MVIELAAPGVDDETLILRPATLPCSKLSIEIAFEASFSSGRTEVMAPVRSPLRDVP